MGCSRWTCCSVPGRPGGNELAHAERARDGNGGIREVSGISEVRRRYIGGPCATQGSCIDQPPGRGPLSRRRGIVARGTGGHRSAPDSWGWGLPHPSAREGPSSGPEVGEDGEHPAVLRVVGQQAELGEDVADVLSTALAESTSRWPNGNVGMASRRTRWLPLEVWPPSALAAGPHPLTRRPRSARWRSATVPSRRTTAPVPERRRRPATRQAPANRPYQRTDHRALAAGQPRRSPAR